MVMCNEILDVLFILVYPMLFVGTNGQEYLPCKTTWGSSCDAVNPLISGPSCPDGFDLVADYYCFKIGHEFLTFNESEHKCTNINATLAEPRGLLNNSVFAEYIWEQEGHKRDIIGPRFGEYDVNTWSPLLWLGGRFLNNSWQWMTGGHVNYPVSVWWWTSYGCLISETFKRDYSYYEGYGYYEGEYSEYYDGEDNVYFRLYGIPCSYKYKYVCEGAFNYTNYRSCEYNGRVYSSGQRVSLDRMECQQQWCQNGIIQTYTCGEIKTDCCEYEGEMYGNGNYLGPEVTTEDCSGCRQLMCLFGNVQWQECRNCSIMCCIFNGESYRPGSYIENACAVLQCNGTTGQFNYMRHIDKKCRKCKAYLDPHIVTYEQRFKSYSYQKCGNYSLSQFNNTYHPTFAVYATFESCGGGWDVTCVESVTFKNYHTFITIEYENDEYKIQVNNEIYAALNTSTNIVHILNSSVLAWISGSYYECVNLQGSSGLLVRFCGNKRANEVYVWAYPSIADSLQGLCGTINNNNFTTRNGNETWPWQWDAPEEFGLSWLTNGSNSLCNNGSVRVKRQTQNRCDANSNSLNEMQNQCIITVTSGFPDAEYEESQAIIDDCVFDLCNVDDPVDWLKTVKQTVQVQAEIQENTIEVTTPRPSTPSPTQPLTQPPSPTYPLTQIPSPTPINPTQPPTSPPKDLPKKSVIMQKVKITMTNP